MIRIGSDVNGTDGMQCGEKGEDPVTSQTIKVNCNPPLFGRYVLISLEGDKTLSLCEVQVYEAEEGG